MILGLISIIAAFLTFYRFPSIPSGINQDEANEGYEAYALLKQQTDQWGYHLPIYFISWGSGQNVAQAYLEIPIIAIFGLNIFSIRLLPALLGLFSIPLLFLAGKKIYDERVGLLSAFLLTILPWHIMVTRWSLEGNILPFFLLLGTTIVLYSYDSKYKKFYIPFSLIIFAFCLYVYAIAMIIIPTLTALLLITRNKIIKKKFFSLILSLIVFFEIALPFSLFIVDNQILHYTPIQIAQMHLITIPLLPANRLSQIQGKTDNILQQNLHFIMNGFNDKTNLSTLPGFAILGPISFISVLLGVIFSIKKRSRNALTYIFWLVASCPLILLISLNVNRANTFYIPFVGLTAIGIIGLYDEIKRPKYKYLFLGVIVGVFSIYSITFSFNYFHNYNKISQNEFNPGLDLVINKAQAAAKKNEKIYISNLIPLNYVQTRFYLKPYPQEFRKDSMYTINNGIYVKNYKNFYFDPNNMDLAPHESYIYILKPGENPNCIKTNNTYSNDIWKVGRCFR
jgi:4-amino-4-deoxy-L-arabinose transferase-like glycosyltransferase